MKGDQPFCWGVVCKALSLRACCWGCQGILHHCRCQKKKKVRIVTTGQRPNPSLQFWKYHHWINFQFTFHGWFSWHKKKCISPIPSSNRNQCPIQFLTWKCKCGCKLSEKLRCLVLIVNASTCMRAAVAFISPLYVTDVCVRSTAEWSQAKLHLMDTQ